EGADDSYRANRRWDSVRKPPRRAAFFVALPLRKGRGCMNFLASSVAAGFVIVFLGGGLGAAIRHGLNLAGLRLLGPDFPYATMFINITGSLIMGLAAAYFAFK